MDSLLSTNDNVNYFASGEPCVHESFIPTIDLLARQLKPGTSAV